MELRKDAFSVGVLHTFEIIADFEFFLTRQNQNKIMYLLINFI